jgi:hypothetical protein
MIERSFCSSKVHNSESATVTYECVDVDVGTYEPVIRAPIYNVPTQSTTYYLDYVQTLSVDSASNFTEHLCNVSSFKYRGFKHEWIAQRRKISRVQTGEVSALVL